MKKLIGFILLLAMVSSLFCPAAMADEGEKVYQEGDYEYTLIEGGPGAENSACIVGYKGGESSLVIPQSLNGYPVTKIGMQVFVSRSELTKVSIPEGITSIDNVAFAGCTSLTEIHLPDSLTFLGNGVFTNCRALAEIELPASLTHIGDNAFNACVSLKEIVIPGSVTYIGKNAFFNCLSLAEIKVSQDNEVYSSTGGILYDRAEKTLLCCPAGYEKSSVLVHEGTRAIGDSAFLKCASLTEVILPDSLTHIGNNAFYYCDALERLILPEGLSHIGDNAFARCASLVIITIPESVLSIGINPFVGSAMQEIFVSPNNEAFKVMDGLLYSLEDRRLICCPDSLMMMRVEIAPGALAIGDQAFASCGLLKTVAIPDTVTYIGDEAFTCCWGLTALKLPAALTHIGDEAFTGCWNLVELMIPAGVSHIGEAAFEDCDALSLVIAADSYAADWADESGLEYSLG